MKQDDATENESQEENPLEEKLEEAEKSLQEYPWKKFVQSMFEVREVENRKADNVGWAFLFTLLGALNPVLVFIVPMAFMALYMMDFEPGKEGSEEGDSKQ